LALFAEKGKEKEKGKRKKDASAKIARRIFGLPIMNE